MTELTLKTTSGTLELTYSIDNDIKTILDEDSNMVFSQDPDPVSDCEHLLSPEVEAEYLLQVKEFISDRLRVIAGHC